MGTGWVRVNLGLCQRLVVYTLDETETADRDSGESVRHLVLGALYVSELEVELRQEI